MPKPRSTADESMVAPLRGMRIRLLGEPSLDAAGAATPIKIDKAAAALAKLSLDGPQPRELLCSLLWPDAEPRDAAISLRQLSHRLSKLAGGVVLLELGATVRLASALPPTDAALPAALPPEDLLQAGPLLAGCDFGKLQELDRWLEEARKAVATRCAEALAAHAESLERERRLHEAIVVARRVVDLVPHGEHGVRRLMRLHYLRHDRAAAKAAYQKLAEALRDVQVEQPSAETERLLQTVLSSEPDLAARRRAMPPSLQHPPVLVGRDQALAAMQAAWARLEPFLLVGDAGLGKTRLLGDFRRGIAGCAHESAYPGDEMAPLGVLGRVLAEIEAWLAPSVPAATRTELARFRPEFGRPAELPADQPRVRQAMAQYLQAAMAAGLEAVVIDDLHHADPDSIDALRWLCAHKSLRTLRWGLATRPPASQPQGMSLTEWLSDSRRPLRIDLQPLTTAELGTLLDSLALPDLRGQPLAGQLFRHAGGIPFFILATLREVLTQGVDLRAQAWPQPASVHALLDSKVGALPSTAQAVLRVAAVAGPELRADRVARMLGRSVLDLAEDWALLEAGHMLAGERFSHDLMQECALRSVPRGVRQALHRQFAALLMHDSSAQAAAIARHWEEGEDWLQAATHWRAAAGSALQSGSLASQISLLERAAACCEQAGDNGGRFEALFARLEALRLRHGGDRVLDVLPTLEGLSDSSLRRLQCKLAAIAALVDLERAQEAAALADTAVAEAALHPVLLSDAHALQAQALAQLRRFDEASKAASRAWALADRAEDRLQSLRAMHAQMYVRYADGWLADAVVWQSRALALSAELGRHSAVASGTGHLAALLAAIGDVRASHAQAQLAQRLHMDLGLAANSTFRIVNAIVLGNAAAAMGQYGEALAALQDAVALAGDEAAPAAHAKSRLALAALWLTLGCTAAAASLLDELPQPLVGGMAMQQLLLRARVAEQGGQSPMHYLRALATWDQAHPDLPLVHSAHFEASYTGEAASMIARLAKVRGECHDKGLTGTAHSLLWRELVRWLECPGPAATDAMQALALQLQPHVAGGLSAKCPIPQVWVTLGQIHHRSGDTEAHRRCIASAQAWNERALATVPPQFRDNSARAHRLDRIVLQAWPSATPALP